MPNKKIMLYKIVLDKKNNNEYRYLPIQTIMTQNKYKMQPGSYLAVNECTSYAFNLNKNDVKHIYINNFKLKFLEIVSDVPQMQQDEQINAHAVNVQCINPITGEKVTFSNKQEFDILPGKNQITVSGTNVKFSFLENEQKDFFISLSPLVILSPIENDTTQYFIKSVSDTSNNTNNTLYAGELNQSTWLIPGKYEVEINGTTTSVDLQSNQEIKLSLGYVRITKPKDFLINGKSKSSLQPIFAYMNKKILFSLDKDYAIFPGKYSISLENSEMEKEIEVLPNSYLNIPTFVAQINPPECLTEKQQSCTYSQKGMIYSKDQPYPIAKVLLGKPFLVLQGEYQYSVEGVDTITKALYISDHGIKSVQTGKVKIKWKLEISEDNIETRKIYLESRCCNLSGKSKDLDTYRPRELLLPEGDYNLSYVIKKNKGSFTHNVIPIHIDARHDVQVQIPIYANANQNTNLFWQDEQDSETSQQPSNLIPLTQ